MKNLQLGGFAAMGCEDKDGVQIVSVSGEVDLYSAHRLRDLIWRAKRQAGGDPARMVVDLSGVEFIDTAGLEVRHGGPRSSFGGVERHSAVRQEARPGGSAGTDHAAV
jgi:STAS domain